MPDPTDRTLLILKLSRELARAYPSVDQRRNAARFSKLDPGAINIESNDANTAWANILEHLDRRGMFGALAAFLTLDDREEFVPAIREIDELDDAPSPPRDWYGPQDESTLEKVIGARSTLVPVAYLRRGLECSRSVARVVLPGSGSGSGFVIPSNRLVTNHHVLRDADAAATARLQFNFEQTAAGTEAPVTEMRLDPAAFFRTSCEDDWTVVEIADDAETDWGAIPLDPRPVAEGDYVNIVQHPGGGQKQISMAANVVVFAGEGRVQYLTDTLPGSSGAPVFDRDWNIVALHHSGGWLTEPNARSKKTFYRNEGIAIERIRDGLA